MFKNFCVSKIQNLCGFRWITKGWTKFHLLLDFKQSQQEEKIISLLLQSDIKEYPSILYISNNFLLRNYLIIIYILLRFVITFL